MYRSLDSEKIIGTVERLCTRIDERFPGSGLGCVCKELLTVARESQQRSAWIAKPQKSLRVMVGVLDFDKRRLKCSFAVAVRAGVTSFNLVEVYQMTLLSVLFVLFIMMAFPVVGSAQSSGEPEAVRQAVLDYVEGVYEVSPTRIERSTHPDLAKRGFLIKKGETVYSRHTMTFPQLVELSNNYNKDGHVPKDAPKEVVVYDISDQTASAKLTAVWGIDYIHLAKYDGKWKIINVLWQTPPKSTK
ncbi:hypothetical protein BH18ACI4_BH18ACI4_06090 [soil metagenome]